MNKKLIFICTYSQLQFYFKKMNNCPFATNVTVVSLLFTHGNFITIYYCGVYEKFFHPITVLLLLRQKFVRWRNSTQTWQPSMSHVRQSNRFKEKRKRRSKRTRKIPISIGCSSQERNIFWNTPQGGMACKQWCPLVPILDSLWNLLLK